tara:strand:- start:286 stop:1005 length:720 start_codon:yes stop_codon:yes gene_type:complete
MKLFNKISNLFKRNNYQVEINRLDTTNDDSFDRGLKKIMNLLNYTKKSAVSYSAGNFDSGYHSMKIGNQEFKGQRNPELRFKDLPFSFKGLSVLDIGCNQGAMISTFAEDLKFGIGIDYDYRMINVANKIRTYNKFDNVNYYVFDLEKENLNYISDFLPTDKVDVILLLSVCMWIKNWKDVISFCVKTSGKLVFETNGNPSQQEEQIQYLQSKYKKVDLIHDTSEDDESQKLRKLYYCY